MYLQPDDSSAKKNVFEAILARRSVRAYSEEEITRKTVHTLLEAAVRAPTVMHEEPWRFVVIQDKNVLDKLADRARSSLSEKLHCAPTDSREAHDDFAGAAFNIFHGAGTLIAICAKPAVSFAGAACWLAAENLMLAACSIGLGTCVIGASVGALNAPEAKKMLGIPAEYSVIAPIVVGVPCGESAATSRKAPIILAWR